MIPQYITRSAKPGEPSVLWIGKSGRQYRSIVAAKKDHESEAWKAPTVQSVVKNASGNAFVVVVVIILIGLIGYKLLKP